MNRSHFQSTNFRKTSRVILGIGSNIKPRRNIQSAIAILRQDFGMLGKSVFMVTKPIESIPQADFLNGAVMIETQLGIRQLRVHLKRIEHGLGRPSLLGRKKIVDKFGPRTIDLDIVVWNDRVVDRDFYEREYLRKSVLELAPELKNSIPDDQKSRKTDY